MVSTKTLLIFHCALHVWICSYNIENKEEFVRLVNNKQSAWVAEVDSYALRSENLLASGSVQFASSTLPIRKSSVSKQRAILPRNVDLRLLYPQCESIKALKHQFYCSSCWAVSVASAFSDRLCVKSSGSINVNISAQYIMSCCSECGNQCESGFPDKAWKFIMDHGAVTGGDYGSKEGCQPYGICPSCEPSNDLICSNSCTNDNYTNVFRNDLYFVSEAYRLPADEEQIRKEIYFNGPVSAGMFVYNDFDYYRKGIYLHVAGNLRALHSVRLIGFGVENNTPYWLAMNSWGSEWGENGTFKIVRGRNECGIETFIDVGIPVIPKVPTETKYWQQLYNMIK